MSTNIENEQKNLQKCFEQNIQLVQNVIDEIKFKKQSVNDIFMTADPWEERLIMNFKCDFERKIIEQKSTFYADYYCRLYFLDLLHQFNYDDETKQFKQQFNIDLLNALVRELEIRLASMTAYQAAYNGDIQTVNEFLKKYPAVKDKSGPWGTTLLYCASRNSHLELVKDLIENHRCSVNAQNRQHILRAVASPHHNTGYYDENSRAGSTALHGACFYGRLDVVKYLVEHNADYYIQNQAGQIALNHAACRKEIAKYFHEVLVFGYSSNLDSFPEGPIYEQEYCQTMDCIWEYKPFSTERWFPFSEYESLEIQKSLLQSNHEFQREVYLRLVKGVYSICLMKFLRSGRNLDYHKNLAWVRCRGSSFVNFDCYALWQIFLTKHPNAASDPIFDMISIPTSYDSQFEFHLRTWYFCNAQIDDQLDKAMKYRRRFVNIKVPLISDEPLKFNLETFSFTNQQNTVCGHVRWVPKMISNNSKNRDEIIDIDEYATMSSLNPIPLTTSRLKQVSQDNEDELIETMNEDDLSNHNDRDPIENIPETPLSATASSPDFLKIQFPLSSNPESENEEPTDDFINETNMTALFSQITIVEKMQETSKTIHSLEYATIKKQIIQEFLVPNHSLVLHCLRETTTYMDSSFHDRVPKMMFGKRDNISTIIIEGFQEHHDRFKQIHKQIQLLLITVESAKDFYERDLNFTMKSMIKNILVEIQPQSKIWTEYMQIFIQLFQDKNTEYKQLFDDYIDGKIQSMTDSCIRGQLASPWNEIKAEMKNFHANHVVLDEVNLLKQRTLDKFIEGNISLQNLTFDFEPTQRSIFIIESFIKKIQTEFQTDRKYQGHETKDFSSIPQLLERLMLNYSCFKCQLPLYALSNDLLSKIEHHMITTVSTPTESGKSTLLPALLIAEGYAKVIVAQPRDLTCQLICRHVNKTMLLDKEPIANKKLAGLVINNIEKNPQGKVLYITDSLLKEYLINNHTSLDKSVVFIIDQVHERSIDIDLCLALLTCLLAEKPQLQNKIKVIISSAIIDVSIPNLFRRYFPTQTTEFEMSTTDEHHSVKTIHCPKRHIIDVVQEIHKKRNQHDQILCFVSSISEVNQYCRLLSDTTQGTIVAYPLVQSQQTNIEYGTVFFSTIIPETSLRFPSLKYVVDTGMINQSVYEIESRQTSFKVDQAAQSILKQRASLLGRTQPGEYYALYNVLPNEISCFQIPQICRSDLMNIEFSLRKSPFKHGLNYLKMYLPNPPSQQLIDIAIEQLQELNILEKFSSDEFTAHGKELVKLPDLGSLAMSKAVLAALTTYDCGRDLICLASILNVLTTTTTIFRSIPQDFKSPEGDFMTLLNIMNRILLIKQSISVKDANIDNICQKIGLNHIQHIIKQSLERYEILQEYFNSSIDFRRQAQQKSGNWELITKALLAGYSDNVFISMKDLQQRTHHFVRHNNSTDIAVLDRYSTLIRRNNKAPISIVLARDIRHTRTTAILSLLGEIKSEWIYFPMKREFEISSEEETYLDLHDKYAKAVLKFTQVRIEKDNGRIKFEGSSGDVLNAEVHLRQQMICELKFDLTTLVRQSIRRSLNFQHNIGSLIKLRNRFNPLIRRWKEEQQVDITINANAATETFEIIVQARHSTNQRVKADFESFMLWFQYCAILHPNSGLPPRGFRPQIRSQYRDIEDRIARVADSKRTPIDLHNAAKGVHATRETRMEVVAWIAVCKFDCKLEGGFVRDWIVGHHRARPPSNNENPKQWIETNDRGKREINKQVVPGDIDCLLPSDSYFNIQKFQDELAKYDITCEVESQNWKYMLLFDENEPTGPFTMDLIEPHITLAYDRIDFDVNNLTVEKDYTRELGMRIDIARKPHSIELETIVQNIKKKRFQLLRPEDHIMTQRIAKMVNVRGWHKIDEELSVILEPYGHNKSVLVFTPFKVVLHEEMRNKMNMIPNLKILRIEEIRNPSLEEIYEGNKKMTKKDCPNLNPNEQKLFYGAKYEEIDNIVDNGFDDRYYTSGTYGRGAYFSDNPLKSHSNTSVNSKRNNVRVIFYSKVLLGRSYYAKQEQRNYVATPRGFHSVTAKRSDEPTEYIVYRYGQALPYLKITYKTE